MTVISQSTPIVCAAGELAVLGALVDAPALVGMEEPFADLDASQVHAALTESTNSLIERGFVQPEADDTLTLDSTIAAMMTVVSSPTRSYFCGLATPRAGLQRHFLHLRDRFAVELSLSARGDSAWRTRYALLPLDADHGLSQRVFHLWHLENQSAAPGERIQVIEPVLHAASAAARGTASAATALLVDGGTPERAARVLAETLATPLRNGMLVAFALDGSQRHARGVGFLEGRNGLWRLRTDRQPDGMRVDVVPCSAVELRQEVRRFISHEQ
jgi:hypothetical protein